MKIIKKSKIEVEIEAHEVLEALGIKVDGAIQSVVISKSKKDSKVKIIINVEDEKE